MKMSYVESIILLNSLSPGLSECEYVSMNLYFVLIKLDFFVCTGTFMYFQILCFVCDEKFFA